jgi:hypothetical protein
MERRKFLSGVGTGSLIGLAGCTVEDTGGIKVTNDTPNESTPTPTQTPHENIEELFRFSDEATVSGDQFAFYNVPVREQAEIQYTISVEEQEGYEDEGTIRAFLLDSESYISLLRGSNYDETQGGSTDTVADEADIVTEMNPGLQYLIVEQVEGQRATDFSVELSVVQRFTSQSSDCDIASGELSVERLAVVQRPPDMFDFKYETQYHVKYRGESEQTYESQIELVGPGDAEDVPGRSILTQSRDCGVNFVDSVQQSDGLDYSSRIDANIRVTEQYEDDVLAETTVQDIEVWDDIYQT